MSLKKLSTAEIVKHGGDLVRRGSPSRAAIEAVPVAKPILPELEDAYETLLDAQPPDGSAVAALTSELGEHDARHDALVRGIDLRLASELSLATDDTLRESLRVARAALFPTGVAIVQRSYVEEAGEAKLRERRMTPELRRVLQKLKCHDGRTLDEVFGELQTVAATIGTLESRRSELSEAGATAVRIGAARNRWIRAIHALSAVLSMVGVDEAPILGNIRAAEARADRRGGGEEPTPSPVEPSPVEPSDPSA